MRNINCLLTGKNVECNDYEKVIAYELRFADNIVEVFVCKHCFDHIKGIQSNNYIVSGLIANKKWPKRGFIISDEHTPIPPPPNSETILWPAFIETAIYPRTPASKMESFFLNLCRMQEFDGGMIHVNLEDENIWAANFFRKPIECLFYLDGLKENGLVTYRRMSDNNAYNVIIGITHLGLNKSVELLEEGENSNKCFIAMAFTEEMKPYREAIKTALIATSFEPIIIDEVHLASDKTIPDGILSGIKKSKFCIADFCNHRNGVYFESGYALGLGKPVIYVCSKTEFEKVHFDIKQLQHIIYTTPQELEKRLIEKIEAWIKD